VNPLSVESAMRKACLEARRWLGATSPNPPVGAAILDESGSILALAAHPYAGAPHAEVLALKACVAAGVAGKMHTLAVTLEPCNHFGRTPPCVAAILDAGIAAVAVGVRDPNPDVKGVGIERLVSAGVDVTTGVAQRECRQLLHAFAFSSLARTPWVTVKRAFTRAGSMIPPSSSATFTSAQSLVLAHRLRKKADAIVTGSGTILADNPQFTTRRVADHPGKRRWLAILDRRRRVSGAYLAAARLRGFDALIFDDLVGALGELHRLGARDVLVEAGPALSESVLASGSWNLIVDITQGPNIDGCDQISWHLNPAMPAPCRFEMSDLDSILPL
jgi:diaminohydroxyphosphoribosylaminopyrimidine deaminase/5-amino-6-(5-phosphoribosylamino)uracil reductase